MVGPAALGLDKVPTTRKNFTMLLNISQGLGIGLILGRTQAAVEELEMITL
jgi:hypothetical protein